MHAILISSPIAAENVERAAETIRGNAEHFARSPGFQNGYWIYDRDNGSMLAALIFDSQAQSDSAWQELGPMVMSRAEAIGAKLTARSCEVVHHA
jgi:hypothetical protein